MSRYRKKPVVVDATQFTEANAHTFVGPGIALSRTADGQFLRIDTLEGTMTADVGDWIITGVNGERYPCKPDIFAKTYVGAEDEEATTEIDVRTLERMSRLLATKSLTIAVQAVVIAFLLIGLALDAPFAVKALLLVVATGNVASAIAQSFEFRHWHKITGRFP